MVWVSGRAAITEEHDGVRAAAAFDRHEGNAVVFRVEVENLTDSQVEVTPREMTVATCAAAGPCSAAFRVIDPEGVLMALDQQEAAEKAAATNEAVFSGSLMLLSAVLDVASLATGKANRDTGRNTARIGAQMDRDDARHHRQLSQIDRRRQSWSGGALRRTTLSPGQSTAGYVYVPVRLQAQLVWLHLRVGGRRIPFCFKQVVYGPQVESGSYDMPETGQTAGGQGVYSGRHRIEE